MNPEVPSPLDPITEANLKAEAQPSQPAAIPTAPAAPISQDIPLAVPSAPTASAPIDAAWQSPLKQIRTYQGDMAEAIQSEHASIASIRAAEKARSELLASQKTEEAPAAAPDPERRAAIRRRVISVLFFIGGLIFIGAAGYGGYYAYTTYKQKTAVPTIAAAPENRFLAVSSTQNVDASVLSRDALVSIMDTERKKPLTPGSIEHIELRQGSAAAATLTTPTEFLLLINAKPPANFVRALDPLFMLGIVGLPAQPVPAPVVIATSTASTTATTTALASAAASTTSTSTLQIASTTQTVILAEPGAAFLLLKLDSYDNAYAGMLDWEKNLADDLLPVFHSAEVVASVPSNATWSDVTIENKDARKLTDASGKTELIYSFYNQNLLVVTTSEAALRSILTALDTQALAR